MSNIEFLKRRPQSIFVSSRSNHPGSRNSWIPDQVRNDRSSFTLIELLVTLAIVAILSVVVVITINPSELIKQARDSTRLSDLGTLNTALGLYNSDVSGGGFMGTSSIVYVSIPSSSGTCATLGLPTLPTGWTYKCSTSANYKKVDGTGWIPVNFNQITFGSPLSGLPVDPQNTTTTQYYTYVTGGSWQMSAKFESQKYQPQAAPTNSYDPSLYVVGNNTVLAPFVGGLVGWWKFDDYGQTTTTDSSGWGRNATWYGTSTDHYATGKVGAYAASFNGAGDYLNYGTINYMAGSNHEQSFAFWDLPAGSSNNTIMCTSQRQVRSETNAIDYVAVGVSGTSYSRTNSGAWEHVVLTTSGTTGTGTMNLYVNGVLVKTAALGRGNAGGGPYIGSYAATQQYFSGYIDDLRVYNRVLTAAEALAIYNSTQ